MREKNFQEADINHFANFWILAKGKNQNKSNKHPADFFKDVDAVELKRAMIDHDSLDYRRFTTFVKQREAQILDVVRKRLQFTESDFADGGEGGSQ